MRRLAPSLSLLCLLTACHSGESNPTAAPATPVAAPAPAPEEVVRGQFVIGKDGYGITLCGEDQQQRIALSDAAEAFIAEFSANGAREFFVDGRGSAHGEGERRIERIERAYSEGPGCDERGEPMRFRAQGNEPFWAITVVDQALRLERPDAPASATPLAETQDEGDQRRFLAGAGAEAISLQLERKTCRDGMADAQFAWTATASVGGQTWHGCAYAGD